MHAGLSILAALIGNRPTKLDVSVAEVVLWLMSLGLDESLATTSPLSFGHDVLSGKYACYALYETADGRHVAVAAIEQKFFANLCRALRVEDAIELQYNDVAQATLRKTLSSKFKQQALADWMRELSLEDVCVAPVLRADEIASWPQFVERGVVASAVAQDGSSMKQLRPLLAGMTQSRPVALIDFAKTDTTEMFSALGFDQEKLSGLEERGVLA
jgi:crotonobetainyl-CoA:carnitine CoA-transferase CaiB-like acyl-CoA transferase